MVRQKPSHITKKCAEAGRWDFVEVCPPYLRWAQTRWTEWIPPVFINFLWFSDFLLNYIACRQSAKCPKVAFTLASVVDPFTCGINQPDQIELPKLHACPLFQPLMSKTIIVSKPQTHAIKSTMFKLVWEDVSTNPSFLPHVPTVSLQIKPFH